MGPGLANKENKRKEKKTGLKEENKRITETTPHHFLGMETRSRLTYIWLMTV